MVEASWSIYANHGGGYSYRLCKMTPGGEPTEACFQRTPLPFATQTQVLKFKDREERITGTFVSEGTIPVSLPPNMRAT